MELLSSGKTALILIDLQKGVVGREMTPHSSTEVMSKANALIKKFMAKGAFVVLVRVSTKDQKDMLQPATDAQAAAITMPEGWDDFPFDPAILDYAYIVTKKQWGAFYGTDLDLQLRRRGIDTIVLGGIATGFGVDTTAREAYQHGYNQIFAEDAMSAITREEHDYVCKYIFPRIGKLRITENIDLD